MSDPIKKILTYFFVTDELKIHIEEGAKFFSRCGSPQDPKKAKMTQMSEEGQAIVAALNLSLGTKIDSVDSKLSNLGRKVDRCEERLDDHEKRFQDLQAALLFERPGRLLKNIFDI